MKGGIMTADSRPQVLAATAVKWETTLTANDRLKRENSTRFWSGIIMATVLHIGVFAFWPELTAADFALSPSDLEFIELPPEIEIPPPPEAIARPATPIMASTDINEDITIAPTTFEDNPVEDLPPPPTRTTVTDISAEPVFTPFTVRPDVRNRREVEIAMEREYPPLLRDAGIGGTVLVWFYIDEEGAVQQTRVHTTSGHRALDDAALRVADIIQFTPALNRDRRVPVWISLPITFVIR
jgi:protein TonB